MIKKLIALLFLACALWSCKGAYTSTSGGKEDIGYISLVGDSGKYRGGVIVSIDNNKPQIVEVTEEGKLYKEDQRMKAPTGKHVVKIMYQNKVVYQQQVFFFAQETKKISLP